MNAASSQGLQLILINNQSAQSENLIAQSQGSDKLFWQEVVSQREAQPGYEDGLTTFLIKITFCKIIDK